MKICPVCSNQFEQGSGRKYCGSKCRTRHFQLLEIAKRAAKRKPSSYCIICGSKTTHRGRTYCSMVCRRKSHPPKKLPWAPVEKTCKHCSLPFLPSTASSLYCRPYCQRRHNKDAILARGGRLNKGYTGWTEQRKSAHQKRSAIKRGASDADRIIAKEIYDRDQWRCGICSSQVDSTISYPDPMSASLDHIVPLSKGGQHIKSNVQCSHLRCNLKKHDKLLVA